MGMRQKTHARDWRENASKKSIFVSDFMHHAFPVLRKRGGIKKILDVACGNGLGVSLPLLRKGYRVHAFDHTKAAIDAAQKNAREEGFRFNTRKASMYTTFPHKTNTFDATFCFQAIYHGRLEDIMLTMSEIRRVTKPGGLFLATFLSHDMIQFEKGRFFITVRLPDGNVIRNYHKQDSSEPHLFYYLSKDFEYMQPHYYFSRDELKVIMGQFFRDIKIKKVSRDDRSHFWFAYGSV